MTHMEAYGRAIEAALRAGNATEHTRRPALKMLVESFGPKIVATNEPARVQCGAPDFLVTRGAVPLGHIETKDVGENLGRIERTEQIQRYREGLSNLVLTDYLEFRWYVDGKLRMSGRIGTFDGRHLECDARGLDQVESILREFLVVEIPTVSSPKELASRMAGIARLMRDTIKAALQEESGEEAGSLHDQMASLRQVLLPELTVHEFADLYAQTLCYGLFAARLNHSDSKPFSREHADYDLPKTNPFLRAAFRYVAGPDLDERLVWAVDDLVELLRRLDVEETLRVFAKHTHGEDRVVYFYEDFLAAYDPKLREARGVYYTPQAVVSYIVRSVDHILRRDFRIKKGLADATKFEIDGPSGEKTESHRVLILDPAAGTGTFLYEVIHRIMAEVHNPGARSSYIREHLLPRLLGFELLVAPYAIAHLKLVVKLKENGYDFKGDERLRVYLTNTLEEAHEESGLPLFAQAIAKEAAGAADIKQRAPVMVVLGNPPYSGHSQNRGDWIRSLLETYKEGCPELHKPGQAKWLSDDYVKFIRFAQWRIEQTGYGVLAFVTNNGYLDNPTFRGMRRSLLASFDDIYILDLHGSSKKKEQTPEGGKDENVFDIQQGVAIGIFVRRAGGAKKPTAIHHAHLWGMREEKYAWLWDHDVESTKWRSLKGREPDFLLAPRSGAGRAEYEASWSLRDIFAPSGDPAPGIVTTHDEFAISWSEKEAADKVRRLLATSSEHEARGLFRLCTQSQWNYERAKRELASGGWKREIVPILYRPFDVRWTVYDRNVAVHRRERVSHHVLAGANLGLATTRAVEISRGWEHVFCTRLLMQHHTVSLKEVNYLFPLYLYPNGELPNTVFAKGTSRKANLNAKFIAEIEEKLGIDVLPDGQGDRKSTFGPDDIFFYIYAVLHAPAYRDRYADFLKADFARVPITSDRRVFRVLCELGQDLVGLHTLEKVRPSGLDFPVAGDNVVEKVGYAPPGPGHKKGRVWINPSQFFEGLVPEAWDFHVGGYKVCEKWLKDRKGQALSYADVEHYEAMASAITGTLGLLPRIDEAVAAHGGWPLK